MKLTDAVMLCTGLVWLGWNVPAPAEDWPQWRYNANRTANSPENLPPRLELKWTRQYAPRVQVWDDPLNNDLMAYDRVLEPVVLGERLFLAFNDADKVVALDLRTGRELWTFYTDGPVRLPPAAAKGRVYVTSDDGYLYCLDAAAGTLVWKHRGGPSPRKVLGNGRVISAWPARGGPVVRDGQVYYAASIWPFMGTFIWALEAETGRLVWANDSTAAQFIKQPHSAPSFAGVAPQGAFVATKDYLLVPGGRSVPAGFDRKTGKLVHYQLEDGGKGNGGSFVMANETEFFVHTRLRGTRNFDLKTGKKGTFTINEPVLGTQSFYSAQESSFLHRGVGDAEQKLAAAHQSVADARADITKAEEDGDAAALKKANTALNDARKKVTRAEQGLVTARKTLGTNWAGSVIQAVNLDKKLRWELAADGSGDLIKAGVRLYAAGTNALLAIEPPAAAGPARIVWSNQVAGRVLRLVAANGHLFAVTLEGRILAFGAAGPASRGETPVPAPPPVAEATLPAEPMQRVETILEQAGTREGYALCYGVDNPPLLEALARQSQLRIVAVETESEKLNSLRRRFDAAGLYGHRIALQGGEPISFKAPPYIAQLVVVGSSLTARLADRQVLEAIFSSVRPYGGTLWITALPPAAEALASVIRSAQLPGAKVAVVPDGVTVTREGPLPGAADWTHQYGSVANPVKSDDQLVRLPLGLLWFGGNTHQDVLPRHGHGPSEQVVGGRLFLEGMSCLSARDVYTGRTLWKHEFGDLGTYGVYYDATYTNAPLSTIYNQKHIAGANARGANFVATADRVYVVVSNTCQVLDARTGRNVREIQLPALPNESESPQWGYLGVHGNVLLAGSGFAHYTRRLALWGVVTNPVPATNSLTATNRALAATNALAAPDLLTATNLALAGTNPPPATNFSATAEVQVETSSSSNSLSGFSTNSLTDSNRPPTFVDLSGSRVLVAFDRHTGQVLWRAEARHSFLHNGIVAGNDRVFCLDKLPKSIEDKLKRRGRAFTKDYRLVALDLRTGQPLWQADTNIFGTWLSYAKEYDVLLQAGASATDRLKDETDKGLATYRGEDGTVLWKRLDLKYTGPCILYRDTILTTPISYKTNAGAFGLVDGQPRFLNNPLTGMAEPWRIYRTYGCNYPVACEHLMTFRSGAAGFYDLENHGGTGNFGGFKSGCSANLIAADGVLNAPDYTRTCTCPYQNQTSLAFVHQPDLADELEYWTHNQFGADTKEGLRLRRIGLNFGAPGDRLAPDGTLWLDHPSVGGASPHLLVTVKGSKTNYFRRHFTQAAGAGPAWVMASGVCDAETITIYPETRKPLPPPPAPKKKAEDEDEDDKNDRRQSAEQKETADQNGAGDTNATSPRVFGPTMPSAREGRAAQRAATQKAAPPNTVAAASTNAVPLAATNAPTATASNAVAAAAKPKTATAATNKVEPVYVSQLSAAPYTVRLYFAEPENLRPGDRVFDVQLQNQPLLRNFDVVAETGGPLRGVVKEFRHIIVKDRLTIGFKPAQKKKWGSVLCGVEMILEEAYAAVPGGAVPSRGEPDGRGQ